MNEMSEKEHGVCGILFVWGGNFGDRGGEWGMVG